jgi:serine/threonine protein kinase
MRQTIWKLQAELERLKHGDIVGQTVSHYRILEKLGEGGMGIVYKAEDVKLGRTVGLKFLVSHSLKTSEEKARFLREAQAAAALKHPGICTVHEIDEADGNPFIVMEYVEGQNLKQRIASGPLPLKQTADIIIQIAEILQEAHNVGIVHRDVNPANIMITDKGRVVLMDFGLAKLSGTTRVTRTGTTLGTASYASPEQIRGEDVDQRSDIWSLGVVFYEMVTGQLPFKGDLGHVVVYSILNTEPEVPTKIRQNLPDTLDRIILRTLEKDRNLRYMSAVEFLKDVRGEIYPVLSVEKHREHCISESD